MGGGNKGLWRHDWLTDGSLFALGQQIRTVTTCALCSKYAHDASAWEQYGSGLIHLTFLTLM